MWKMPSSLAAGGRPILVVDLDGTLIPNLVEWEELRARIAEMLNVHPDKLRPLGERVLSMGLDEETLRRVLGVVEDYELRALKKLDPGILAERRRLLADVKRRGFVIVIVSMRSSQSLWEALRAMEAEDLVDMAVSRDNAPGRLEQLRLIASRFKDRCMVFVGDTERDLEAGSSLGIYTIILRDYRELEQAIVEAFRHCLGEGLSSGAAASHSYTVYY